MQLIDANHKFYRPLWVRILVVAICASWSAVEFYAGASFWLVIVGALTVYTTWVLLIRFNPQPDTVSPNEGIAADPELDGSDADPSGKA